MNIGVILAAGRSTRFGQDVPKQLYKIDGKSMIDYSIDILSKTLDELIIITNSECFTKIKTDKTILINDIDSRIESIKVAVDFIKNKNCKNILIHDCARPFINEQMINQLIESQNSNKHSQFYLPITNGLAHLSDSGKWIIPNRSNYIQLCSPQITDFRLFHSIFTEYIEVGKECEILPVVSKMNLNFNLIEGNNKYLKKITNIDDI